MAIELELKLSQKYCGVPSDDQTPSPCQYDAIFDSYHGLRDAMLPSAQTSLPTTLSRTAGGIFIAS